MTSEENWTFLTGRLEYILEQPKNSERHEVEYLVHADNLDALVKVYGVTNIKLQRMDGKVGLYRFVLERAKVSKLRPVYNING